MDEQKPEAASEGSIGQSASTGWLCHFGWHRPLFDHREFFVDSISGKTVFAAECKCGLRWMVDSPNGWLGFKVQRNTHNAELRGASPLAGAASLSNDVLCGAGGKAEGGESV